MTCLKYKRRDFITKTLKVAALFFIPGLATCSSKNITGKSGWSKGKQINPEIGNTRVICCHDPAMISGDPSAWDMVSQNEPVVRDKVRINLDIMAMTLAQAKDAKTAWSKILRKPGDKDWGKVRAALKVNSSSKNHPRLAIVEKMCDVLHDMGMLYKNIIIYDAVSDASSDYAEFTGKDLPEDAVVSKKSNALGGMIKTYVPEPNVGMYKCVKHIANGEIDILINLAVNKGAEKSVGGTTLAMKNHAGTFNPRPIHRGGGLDYILAFNQSEAILGGDPVRQQLCIIDSLWAMTKGPMGVPDKRLARLVMGTFAPAVDYLTVKRIREPLMGAAHYDVDRFMSSFGYTGFENLDLVYLS